MNGSSEPSSEPGLPIARASRLTPEVVIVGALLVLSVLALLFIGSLVAPAKILLGRSLTAIPPNLFPTIIISAMVILCVALLSIRFRHLGSEPARISELQGWQRGLVFFGIMTGYALLMEPIGFISSSAIAIALISWLVGNRSIPQIVVLSVVSPVLLYFAATRLLAVSLPELNVFEMAISQLPGV